VPVCLHCGEISSEGALFCAKCGYTLPQEESPVSTIPAGPRGAVAAAPLPPTPPSGIARHGFASSLGGPGSVSVPTPGAAPPIPPPPSAKYCVRCATLISRVAVYCPVCQQPQP